MGGYLFPPFMAEGSSDHTGTAAAAAAAAEVIVFGNLRGSEECNDVIKCDLMIVFDFRRM
jgi:hypothetical protein